MNHIEAELHMETMRSKLSFPIVVKLDFNSYYQSLFTNHDIEVPICEGEY